MRLSSPRADLGVQLHFQRRKVGSTGHGLPQPQRFCHAPLAKPMDSTSSSFRGPFGWPGLLGRCPSTPAREYMDICRYFYVRACTKLLSGILLVVLVDIYHGYHTTSTLFVPGVPTVCQIAFSDSANLHEESLEPKPMCSYRYIQVPYMSTVARRRLGSAQPSNGSKVEMTATGSMTVRVPKSFSARDCCVGGPKNLNLLTCSTSLEYL